MNLGLSLASAILLVLVFPRFNLTRLAPIALAPMLIACARELSRKRRFLYGWAAGIVFWFSVCYWIQGVLAVHGGLGGWLSWVTVLLFAVLMGMHLALFAALAVFLMNKPWAVPATRRTVGWPGAHPRPLRFRLARPGQRRHRHADSAARGPIRRSLRPLVRVCDARLRCRADCIAPPPHPTRMGGLAACVAPAARASGVHYCERSVPRGPTQRRHRSQLHQRVSRRAGTADGRFCHIPKTSN